MANVSYASSRLVTCFEIGRQLTRLRGCITYAVLHNSRVWRRQTLNSFRKLDQTIVHLDLPAPDDRILGPLKDGHYRFEGWFGSEQYEQDRSTALDVMAAENPQTEDEAIDRLVATMIGLVPPTWGYVREALFAKLPPSSPCHLAFHFGRTVEEGLFRPDLGRHVVTCQIIRERPSSPAVNWVRGIAPPEARSISRGGQDDGRERLLEQTSQSACRPLVYVVMGPCLNYYLRGTAAELGAVPPAPSWCRELREFFEPVCKTRLPNEAEAADSVCPRERRRVVARLADLARRGLAQLDAAVDAMERTGSQDEIPSLCPGKCVTGGRMPDLSQEGSQAAASTPAMRSPTQRAWQVWQLQNIVGLKTQVAIAQEMTDRGDPIDQGTVSRLLKSVEDFIKAGGKVPKVPAPASRPKAIDPSKLDMGKRRDQHTPRQRLRRRDDDDNGRR